jgi:hypothetical protein
MRFIAVPPIDCLSLCSLLVPSLIDGACGFLPMEHLFPYVIPALAGIQRRTTSGLANRFIFTVRP